MDAVRNRGGSMDLEQLGNAEFNRLSESEIKTLRAAAKGTTAYCGPNKRDDDLTNDPAQADNWSTDRQVRSGLIRWLCLDPDARRCVDPRGIQLYGAKINGALDLSFAIVHFPLRLSRCRLSDDWNLNYVEIPSLLFTGTWMRSLTADGAHVKGSVILKELVCDAGKVQMRGAVIDGELDCGGGRFENPATEIAGSGMALNAKAVKVGGPVLLNAKFSAIGEVNLFNAEIGADLDCGGGRFENPATKIAGSGIALNACGAKVGGSVFVRYNFQSDGEVDLSNAKIGGDLDCSGQSSLNANDSGTDAKAAAEDTMQSERGTSKFQNSPNIENPGSGTALNAVGAKVGGSVFLRWGFSANGLVRLFGAEIERMLDCGNGEFQNPKNGIALDAEILKVGGSVFLNKNFLSKGEVRLLKVQIGGDLDCGEGRFQNSADTKTLGSGVALNAEGIHVEGSMLLSEGFSPAGAVNLSRARITKSFKCDNATFDSLDLTDAFTGSIIDDESSWPEEGKLFLDGFVYDRISGGPRDAAKRLAWLQRQPPLFARQPYQQLASILGDAGDDLGARRVLSKMQRTAWEQSRWPIRTISHLLRFTIGYGYFPLRAVWLLLALVFIGSSVYWVAYNMGSIVPIQKEAYASFEAHCSPTTEYEHFHTIAYSLENSFPLIKLGVQDKWGPAQETRVPVCVANGTASPLLQVITAPGFLRWFRWIQICLGWVLTTLFVGGVTGVVRKN
jgi:hypothetical protein